MPIDARIPLMAERPRIMSPADMVSLQALSTQSKRQATALQQEQRQLEEQQAAQQILSAPDAVDETGMPTLASIQKLYSVSPETGQRLAQMREGHAARQESIGLQRIQAQVAVDAMDSRRADRLKTSALGQYRAYLGVYEARKAAGASEEDAMRAATEARLAQIDEDFAAGNMPGLTREGISQQLSTPLDPMTVRGRLKAMSPQEYREERKVDIQAQQAETAETRAKTADTRAESQLAIDRSKLEIDKAKLALEQWKADNPQAKLDKVTPENAGKFASMKSARKDIDQVRGIVFDAKGNLNYGALTAANVPFTGGVGTTGRSLKSAIYNISDVILRMRTGAAANESEVRKLAETFSPSPLDTKESAKFKLDRMQELFDEAISIAEQSMPSPEAKPSAPPLKTSPKATKTPLEPYSDPDKERRYQEWKSKQK